jgi:MFS family permease
MRRLPSEWRDLLPVMLTATLVGMTFSLAMPLLSLVLERHGVDSWVIGLNTAASGLGIFVVAPLVPWLMRSLGVVGCARVGLLVAAGSMLIFPLWIDPWFWFAVRLLLGMSGSLLFILSEAAVNAIAPDAIRGRVIGVYATLFCLGFLAGPLVLVVAGSEGWTPFLLGSGMFLAGLVPARMLAPVERRLRPEAAGTHRLVDTWRVAPLAMGGVFVYAVLEASQFALLPLYALDRGMGEAMAASLLSVWLSGNILFQYPLGWLADRWPRLTVMAWCAVLALCGQFLVPWAIRSPALLWPLLVLLGGLMGGLYTLALALIGERFRGADLTNANTAFVMTFQLGAIAGPPYAGATMHLAGAAIFPFTLVLPLAALAGALLARAGAPAAAARRRS